MKNALSAGARGSRDAPADNAGAFCIPFYREHAERVTV